MTETLLAADVTRLDAADPLAHFRARFHLRDGLIYLDGNSLGALPTATADRLARVVAEEWGEGLITSWLGALWSTGSDERRVRKECGSRCRSRWSPTPSNKKPAQRATHLYHTRQQNT